MNSFNEKQLHFKINEKQYSWPEQYITGAEVRKLGNIPNEDEIFLKIREPWIDEPVSDDTRVDLARPGIEKFFSKSKSIQVILIVNGREKQWSEERISYDQVVKLAYPNYVENGTTYYTVTYDRGPHQNPEGSMVKGVVVIVKNKMIFNVTPTDKS